MTGERRVDRSTRRCGWGECPHDHPRLDLKAGLWQWEGYVDSRGGGRRHTWVECCSVTCLVGAVREIQTEPLEVA